MILVAAAGIATARALDERRGRCGEGEATAAHFFGGYNIKAQAKMEDKP
jgi:hypothetical protein